MWKEGAFLKCPKCGEALPHGSKFCQYCGSSIQQKPIRKSIVVLIVLFSLSLISNAYLSYQYYSVTQQVISEKSIEVEKRKSAETKAAFLSSELEKAKNEISKLSERVEQLDFVSDLMAEDLDFYENSIGFITPTGKKYHTIHCHYFEEANEYWAHNIEYCENLGYEPCSQCHR